MKTRIAVQQIAADLALQAHLAAGRPPCEIIRRPVPHRRVVGQFEI